MHRAPLLLVLCALFGACAGGSDTPPRPDSWWQPQSDQSVTPGSDYLVPQPGREAGPLPRDSTVTPEPDSTVTPEPDLGPEFNCGPADSECTDADYMKSCTGGKCFARECCCPTDQQCRAGSFPVCCKPGLVCKNTATGECG